MKALGRHILAEMYDCDVNILNDRNKIREIMVNAALEAGAEVREHTFHQFQPYGISGVVVISESHLTVHTWPEHGYAAIDVFTCGDNVDPWEACNYISRHLAAGRVTATETKRGMFARDFAPREPVARKDPSAVG